MDSFNNDFDIYLYADNAKFKKWSDARMLHLNVNKFKTASYGTHINLDSFYYIENEESIHQLEKMTLY
jgi:hypothetical protein